MHPVRNDISLHCANKFAPSLLDTNHDCIISCITCNHMRNFKSFNFCRDASTDRCLVGMRYRTTDSGPLSTDLVRWLVRDIERACLDSSWILLVAVELMFFFFFFFFFGFLVQSDKDILFSHISFSPFLFSVSLFPHSAILQNLIRCIKCLICLFL